MLSLVLVAALTAAPETIGAPSAPAAAAPPQHYVVGRDAPDFTLSRLSDGDVALRSLRGKTVVLVVSSSMASADGSRDWMLELVKAFADRTVEVFNIALVDKPWWMPRGMARSRLLELVPENGHDHVLVEWGRSFLDLYQIGWNREPYVIVIDAKGVVRHLHNGLVSKPRLTEVLQLVMDL